MDGQIWLEADQVTSSPRLELNLKNGAKVGWGGQLARLHPWNRLPTTLDAPYTLPTQDLLTALIDECWQRLPQAGALTLNPDFSVPDDDRRMRWVGRQFPTQFAGLIRLMVKHGLASSEAMPASGKAKIRVHFDITWAKLRESLRQSETPPQLQGFFAEARSNLRG